MPRFDIWLDADKQAAMFHAWLMDEDWSWLTARWAWSLTSASLPRTISAANEIPTGRTSKSIRCAPR